MTANGDDERVLAGMARALKPGGRLVLSAFNAYFAVKYFAGGHDGADADNGGATFDADTGVNHEHTEVLSETGEALTVDLWTGCYTPRELRLLCRSVGLEVESISSVEPGAYGSIAPTTETPELLVIARPRLMPLAWSAAILIGSGIRRALYVLVRKQSSLVRYHDLLRIHRRHGHLR